MEIDASGAGDHLDKVDTKICRIKELMGAVVADLPFKIDEARLKDLGIYAVNRMNVKRTAGLSKIVCPRVKFTGVRPDHKNEYGLAFGDYVEEHNPRAQRNDVTVPGIEPCIALYPLAN